MSKNYRGLAITAVSLILLFTSVLAQEKKKGETISTQPQLVKAKLVDEKGRKITVNLEALFTLTAFQSDGTLTGNLKLGLTKDDRVRIAGKRRVPLTNIPSSFTLDDVSAEVSKYDPAFHLEFKELRFKRSDFEVNIGKFGLNIIDNGREIYLALRGCAMVRLTGSPARCGARRINEIINGLDPAN